MIDIRNVNFHLIDRGAAIRIIHRELEDQIVFRTRYHRSDERRILRIHVGEFDERSAHLCPGESERIFIRIAACAVERDKAALAQGLIVSGVGDRRAVHVLHVDADLVAGNAAVAVIDRHLKGKLGAIRADIRSNKARVRGQRVDQLNERTFDLLPRKCQRIAIEVGASLNRPA
jgi:hypothetical protein